MAGLPVFGVPLTAFMASTWVVAVVVSEAVAAAGAGVAGLAEGARVWMKVVTHQNAAVRMISRRAWWVLFAMVSKLILLSVPLMRAGIPACGEMFTSCL